MRCKVGDMARLVKAMLPENLGTIVEVVRADTYYDWVIKPAWPIRSCNLLGVSQPSTREVFVYDDWLEPIRPAPEKVERDEEVTA